MRITSLKNDPRVLKAKELLLEASVEHTRKLTEISAPLQNEAVQYKQLIDAFASLRGAPLFYPYLGSGFGHGALVELLDGSVKYDLITGIGVHFLGHSHPALIEAAFDSALGDTIMQGNLQQNVESVSLIKLLVEASGLPHGFLTSSGVMAVENGLKIAFQKNAPANRILAFEHCFAGRSTTCSQITDKPAFREGLPTTQAIDYLPFYDPAYPKESTEAALHQLKRYLQRYPKGYAVMICELVQGEGGFYVGSQAFFEPLMQLCKEHHIAVFVDEVQTFARTPRLFAFQHFGLEKYVDIVAIGKLTQVCATLFTQDYCPKPGLLSQTFTGSSASILACLAILNLLLKGNFYGEKGRNAAIHRRFSTHLQKIEQEKLIQGPYGIGAMIAFTPLDGSFEIAKRVAHALFEAGVITFIAGNNPTRIRMLPPAAVITDEQIDQVMEIIHNTLRKSSHVSH